MQDTNNEVVSVAILLCSYPRSPRSSSFGELLGKLTNQLWELVSYASFWLLTEMEVCPCPCFGLSSRLCAEFLALVHFRRVAATLQPLHLPVAAIFSPYPVPGHIVERDSKFMETSLNGQHILCGAFLSPCFSFSCFWYQTARQDS